MIVIASCKDDYLDENLKYIRAYNRDKKVLVIQNVKGENSEYISKKYDDLNLTIVNSDKNLREWGSWWLAYSLFPNEKFYCFIHDSMYLKQNVSKFVPKKDSEIFAFATMNGWGNKKHAKNPFAKSIFKKIKIKEKDVFNMKLIFGCMFICRNSFMKKMKKEGITEFYAKDRNTACCSERVLGVIVKHFKYRVISYTEKIPSGKNAKGVASLGNKVKSENDLFVKIRSGRGHK
ncbi:hypothetical protein N9W84_00405 [bacterium]|nr:hypothetical protein [bacterium]